MRRSLALALLLLTTRAADAQKRSVSAPKLTVIIGDWRVEHGVAAPWLRDGTQVPDTKTRVGSTIRFNLDHVIGAGALSCARAAYETISQPAQGLFQGNLPAPAKKSAVPLGITKFPVPGTRLNCDTGSYDFHRVDANTLLVGLDNVIWTLTRAPGALAAATTPSGVVELFLEQHFMGDMGFIKTSIDRKQQWLTDTLRTKIMAYLARPSSPDEVPEIDGDPFTDSQEYPTRFAVSTGVITGSTARVTVRFADGYRDRVVYYLLHQQSGQWRISDTRCEHKVTLTSLLK